MMSKVRFSRFFFEKGQIFIKNPTTKEINNGVCFKKNLIESW